MLVEQRQPARALDLPHLPATPVRQHVHAPIFAEWPRLNNASVRVATFALCDRNAERQIVDELTGQGQ
jgi:hypothetical protein